VEVSGQIKQSTRIGFGNNNNTYSVCAGKAFHKGTEALGSLAQGIRFKMRIRIRTMMGALKVNMAAELKYSYS
jgi:hypothetical protein